MSNGIDSTTVPIEQVLVSAYKVPTDFPEADGTFEWDSTIIVVVQIEGGGLTGTGFTYADTATATFVQDVLRPIITGQDAMAVTALWDSMVWQVRNHGRPGIASMAISAVDVAVWDLKARLLNLPLVSLLGQVQDGVAIYGSGGFTSYPIERLKEQLGNWVGMGIPRVKMKIGSAPSQDIERVGAARDAIGNEAELFVDANGAYDRKQALYFAEVFTEFGVTWFEEPVSSDDHEGLHLMRDRAPSGMDIATGEYGYDIFYFRRLLQADCVDVLQADATRCGGVTGFLQVAALCRAFGIPLSAHTAPTIHVHPCCAAAPLRHLEYFHDHVRIEHMFLDGVLNPLNGVLYPDLSRPGIGVEFKYPDAEPYAI